MEADGRPQKKPTSPWLYVGCGCGAVVILGMLGIAGTAWWGMRKAKEIGDTLADPEKRAAKVQEVLPYQELPAGYYPAFSLSAPFGFMEMAILADREPTATQKPTSDGQDINYDLDFEERGFIYMNIRDFKNDQDKLRRFLRGEAPLPQDSPLDEVERELRYRRAHPARQRDRREPAGPLCGVSRRGLPPWSRL